MIIVADDPHAMSTCSNKLGDCSGKGGRGVYCKDRDLILSVSNTLFEFDDGEEMRTRRAKEMCRGRTCNILNIHNRNIPHEHFLPVDNRNGRYPP